MSRWNISSSFMICMTQSWKGVYTTPSFLLMACEHLHHSIQPSPTLQHQLPAPLPPVPCSGLKTQGTFRWQLSPCPASHHTGNQAILAASSPSMLKNERAPEHPEPWGLSLLWLEPVTALSTGMGGWGVGMLAILKRYLLAFTLVVSFFLRISGPWRQGQR